MLIPFVCECGHRCIVETNEADSLTECPACGLVAKHSQSNDFSSGRNEIDISATSGKAILSLGLGILFFFGCLSGLPAVLIGHRSLREMHQSNGRLKGRKIAWTGIILGYVGCFFTLVLILMPATRSAREAARRMQCASNLRQIGIAIQNYSQIHGCLPPAAITDKTGQPLLSWRVAILPYLDTSTALYHEFHLDEPWDSPHNLPLVGRMPMVFRCPSDAISKPAHSGYQVVVGPTTAFRSDFQPTKFNEFVDELRTTLLVGETKSSVPWSQPEDLRRDNKDPLHGLGSYHGTHLNGFNVEFADGSIRFLRSSTGPKIIEAYLTPAGQEKIPDDDL